MRKSELNKIIDEGIGRNRQFLAVKIFTDGNPTPEIIVNQIESVLRNAPITTGRITTISN